MRFRPGSVREEPGIRRRRRSGVDDLRRLSDGPRGRRATVDARLLLTGAPEVAQRRKRGRCLCFCRRSRALAAAHFFLPAERVFGRARNSNAREIRPHTLSACRPTHGSHDQRAGRGGGLGGGLQCGDRWDVHTLSAPLGSPPAAWQGGGAAGRVRAPSLVRWCHGSLITLIGRTWHVPHCAASG